MMQRTRLLSTAVALICLPLVALLYVGCEDEPSSEGLDSYFERNPYISDPRTSPSALSISPNQAQVSSIGQAIAFKVNGGTEPYEWAVSKSDVGTIERLGNSEALYTAIQIADNNVIVADRNGQAAIGDIARVAGISLQIIPDTATVSNAPPGRIIRFRVVGGAEPYGSWTVTFENLGTTDQNGVYTTVPPQITNPPTPRSTGRNTISITDSRGSVATASVVHQ